MKNICLNKSKFSSRFALFKHGKKNKFSEFFSACFWKSLLCLKRKVLYEFLQKCFKTTERLSLAVHGLLYGEKHFLLIFICFYRFNKKKLLKKIQIFFRIFPFSNMVKKKKYPSISVFVSEIITFMSKKKGSLWISLKMLQNNRKA